MFGISLSSFNDLLGYVGCTRGVSFEGTLSTSSLAHFRSFFDVTILYVTYLPAQGSAPLICFVLFSGILPLKCLEAWR